MSQMALKLEFNRLVNSLADREEFTIVGSNLEGGIADGESTKPLVLADIVYADSEQADINANPLQRDTGVLLFTIAVKELTGTVNVYEISDILRGVFQRKYIEHITTSVGILSQTKTDFKGWVGYNLRIPFTGYYTID